MPKEFELITCPNPECKEKIGELIIVSDVSTIPVERYYACPRCFFKLDVISAQFLRKEKMREHAEEEKGSLRCPHDVGYLASLPEDEPIPRKCLACPKVLDCALKTNDS